MADHYSFSVQKIRFLNPVFTLFNSPIVMKYDGVSRLEIFLFPYVYVYMSGLLSEVLVQEGHPQPQLLKIKIKI